MEIRDISREEFLSLLLERRRDDDVAGVRSIKAVWASGEEDLLSPVPTSVVVEKSELRDFLAWAGAFISPYFPVTSFVRVLDTDLLVALGRSKISEGTGIDVGRVLTALVLAESLCGEGGTLHDPARYLGRHLETLSFSLGRGIVLGYSPWLLEQIRMRHSYLTGLVDTGHASLESLRGEVLTVYQVICSLLGREVFGRSELGARRLADLCRQVVGGGTLSADSFDEPSLKGCIDGHSQDLRVEDRVRSFRSASGAVRPTNSLKAFVLGYLLARVSRGTLAHWHLLRRLGSDGHVVLPWYALCTSLMDSSGGFLTDGPIHMQVFRELAREPVLYGRPTCDIAIEELSLIVESGEGGGDTFRRFGFQTIEMVPGVDFRMRMGRGRWYNDHEGAQLGLNFAGDDRDAISGRRKSRGRKR